MNYRITQPIAAEARKPGRTVATLAAVVLLVLLVTAPAARAARIKDISTVQGIRSNQLYGFGLVVGLAGTGDGSEFTSDIARNMLERMRVGRGLEDVAADNLAAVIVTAELPPFVRAGATIDVTVSSFDESSSLRGGTLLLTPLAGADGQVYAVAQGPISVGGFAFSGAAASAQQGHPTVGRIPNGANVEREVPTTFIRDRAITLCLRTPDFTTASRMAEAIDAQTICKAEVVDAGSVRVQLPRWAVGNEVMRYIGELQGLSVQPDARAVVVINEKTGTVVAGEQVGISAVAVSHGNLTVITQELPQVSQPEAFASSGTTETVDRTAISIIEQPLREEQGGSITVLRQGTTVSDVARAMNLLGASPRDIISIFQAMKEAGALHAELRIM